MTKDFDEQLIDHVQTVCNNLILNGLIWSYENFDSFATREGVILND